MSTESKAVSLTADDLKSIISGAVSEAVKAAKAPNEIEQRKLDQEKQKIEAALAESAGRVSGHSGAAAILGVPASTLESKIRSLKINKFRFKSR